MQFLVLIFLFMLFLCDAYAYVKEAKILAIVDNEIISNLDLERRVRLIEQFVGKNDQKSKDLLQYLIDEHLFLKYAKDFNIIITDAEVDDAIKNLGIKGINFDYDELFTQIKAKIIWNKMMSQYIIPTTSVGVQEIDNYMKDVLTYKGTVNLVKFVKKSPSDWEEIKIGWVEIEYLDPVIRSLVEKLDLNTVSSEINIGNSVVKFKVTDIENIHVLKTSFKIRKLKSDVTDYKDEYCLYETLDAKGSEFSAIMRKNLISIKENQLSNVIYDKTNNESSEYRILLCNSSLRQEIHQHIFISKIEEEQKKYLAKLRENSFIKIVA